MLPGRSITHLHLFSKGRITGGKVRAQVNSGFQNHLFLQEGDFLFLLDSALGDCMFVGIYPFLPDCAIFWYIVVCSIFKIIFHTSVLCRYHIFWNIRCTFPPQIWEENGGESYSPNVDYLAYWGGGVRRWNVFFFPIFPPLKPRCVLWASESYSPKNTVLFYFWFYLFGFSLF